VAQQSSAAGHIDHKPGPVVIVNFSHVVQDGADHKQVGICFGGGQGQAPVYYTDRMVEEPAEVGMMMVNRSRGVQIGLNEFLIPLEKGIEQLGKSGVADVFDVLPQLLLQFLAIYRADRQKISRAVFIGTRLAPPGDGQLRLSLVFSQVRFHKNNGVDSGGPAGVVPDPARDVGFPIGEPQGQIVFVVAGLPDAALPDDEGAAERLPGRICTQLGQKFSLPID